MRVKPHLLALVQGDTSTTMLQPLDEIGAICATHGVLFYSDATASLGGNDFETDAWGLDAATAGLQKCLGGPSGSAPITLSRARRRGDPLARTVEAGIREDGDAEAPDFVRSNYFDLGDDPRLLGSAAPEPPHRGDVDALRARASARAFCCSRGAMP